MGVTKSLIQASLLIFAAAPALAGDLYSTPGMPVCDSPEHLKEYLIAGIKKDAQWMAELVEYCPPVIGGLKVAIIEDLPSDTDIMHVVKIRVFSPNGPGSVTGYVVNIGLTDSRSTK